MPATAALHKLGVHSITYFSETANDPLELAAIHWPNAIPIGDIEFLTEELLTAIAQRHPGALFWITGGVPCTDAPSQSLIEEGANSKQMRMCKLAARTKTFMSSLVSNLAFTFECKRMDAVHQNIFSEEFGVEPFEIDNDAFSPMKRPRWWWVGGTPCQWKEARFEQSANPSVMKVHPIATPVALETCLLPGYWPCCLGSTDKEDTVSPSTCFESAIPLNHSNAGCSVGVPKESNGLPWGPQRGPELFGHGVQIMRAAARIKRTWMSKLSGPVVRIKRTWMSKLSGCGARIKRTWMSKLSGPWPG